LKKEKFDSIEKASIKIFNDVDSLHKPAHLKSVDMTVGGQTFALKSSSPKVGGHDRRCAEFIKWINTHHQTSLVKSMMKNCHGILSVSGFYVKHDPTNFLTQSCIVEVAFDLHAL
jgi:hypothetical protein